MANEYLKRTPTSTGNKKSFTWAGWVKLNDNNTTWLLTASPAKDNNTLLFVNSNGLITFFDRQGSDPTTEQIRWNPYFRDLSSWKHIIINADTTQGEASERVKCYVNGVMLERDETASLLNNSVNVNTPTQDQDFWRLNGSGYAHYIGAQLDNSLDTPNANQFTDIFYVDGQQLGPEVFGFYKDGNGQVAVGSSHSPHFINGRWVPRSPKEIKKVVNARGGFGVNGFYLPMNDSSNVGADFHTTPNSIITLKGENLPQPRNGAPDTTDAYVSQLRSDPYAANLVLAVPGISTATGANLVTNPSFDTNLSGWTVEQGTVTWSSGSAHMSGASGNSFIQDVTTVVGKRYTMSAEVSNTGDVANNIGIELGETGDLVYVASNTILTGTKVFNTSFTATSTSTEVRLWGGTGATGYWSNVTLKQEDAPRDYSADIKGSGTNKTLTANGGAGVGYEIPSYYGSALSFDGTDDYFSVPNTSDFRMGSDDFTVECWFNANDFTGGNGLVGIWNYTGGIDRRSWLLYTGSSNEADFIVSSNGTSAGQVIVSSPNNTLTTNQWNHLVGEKEGNTIRLYVNGVVVGISTVAPSSLYENTDDTLKIGTWDAGSTEETNGYIQDVRVYKGVAKYKGVGFDVPKPYTPIGIDSWRTVPDTCMNNFASINPLLPSVFSSGDRELSDGNLKVKTITTGSASNARSTIGISTGKWYMETLIEDTSNTNSVSFAGFMGIGRTDGIAGGIDIDRTIYWQGQYYNYELNKNYSVTARSQGGPANFLSTGDIVGFAVNADTGEVDLYKNGTKEGLLKKFDYDMYPLFLLIEDGASGSYVNHYLNFGQNPSFCGMVGVGGTFTDSNGRGLFKYEPPSGYLSLCSANLPEPEIPNPGDYFKAVGYLGSDDEIKINVGFRPDFVWIKERTSTSSHQAMDVTREQGNLIIFPNSTTTDYDREVSAESYFRFHDDGFTMTNDAGINDDGQSYIAYCWKAGGSELVKNTDGTIPSITSVSQKSGFSIVNWESQGSNTATETVGHGLSKSPDFIIMKNRDAVTNWRVYHRGIEHSTDEAFDSLAFNTTEVGFSFFPTTNDHRVFGLANSTTSGEASGYERDSIIAYCWHNVDGFSRFGTYTGNGDADGPFVYCGFKPAFVMLKAFSATGNWIMTDNVRTHENPKDLFFVGNSSNGDDTGGTIDFLSNGFKLRLSSSNFNGNGVNYVFAAWAESPFKYTNAN